MSYLGTKKQMQFVRSGNTTPFDGANGALTAAAPTGGQDLAPDADSTNDITNGAVTVPANASHNTAEIVAIPRAAGSNFRAFDALTTTVPLYYVNTGVTDETPQDGIDQTRVYLERDSEGGTITYNVVNVVEVTLDLASSFEHLNYGLWNGLGSDGNSVADLGIGFVAATADGMGMTEEMPNHGEATYNGNWVANVQERDPQGDGTITRQDGTASIMADFTDDEVNITLTGLITLEGDITGNTFMGDTAKVHDTDATTADTVDNTSGLALDAKLEGTFNGGFFGTLAVEAGGVFDFSTKDNKDGAVRGAFGGKR